MMNEPTADDARAHRTLGHLAFAHALDHYMMLIWPTVVISLGAVFDVSYATLIALGTASFVAFGVFALPAGWLADRWSRRNMMVLYLVGAGVSLIACAAAPNIIVLSVALFAMGVFAAIYHPVGTPMLLTLAKARGAALAWNGVAGNVGAAIAAGCTAVLAYWLGWRWAFVVPGVLCLAAGYMFWRQVPDDSDASSRAGTAEVPLGLRMAAVMAGLFVVSIIAGGIIFNTITVALPKMVEERLGGEVSLLLAGTLATLVFLVGAVSQVVVGRLADRLAPHAVFVVTGALQLVGIVWAAQASGMELLLALAILMAAIYGQVTVNDLVISRYTADAWRSRIYAVRFFLAFATAGAAVGAIAWFHARGGFETVLWATAAVAAVFVAATTAIGFLAMSIENRRRDVVAAE